MSRTSQGKIYQRGQIYWIDYGFRGKRYRESSKSTKFSDAKAFLRKRLAEMGSGKFVGPAEERLTFEHLAEMIETDYKINARRSTRRLATSLNHLRDFFAMSRALDISMDRVLRYIAHRQDEGAANASIQKELAALKRAFNLAVQAGRLSTAPYIPSVKVNNTREGFFETEELNRLIRELPEPLRPLVQFAAFTGWRKSEVLGLRWSDVDFEAGEVRLWHSKNDEPRSFPFAVLPPLKALLDEQRERTRTLERKRGEIVAHVFHRNGKPIRSMDAAWRSAAKRAGMEGALFHDLRRTAVRNLERAGVPRSVAMKLTGHKTESVYRRYAIADAKALEEGVQKLARLHEATTETTARKVVPIKHATG